MSKYVLSASAIATTATGTAMLTLSICDENGTPVSNIRKSQITVSHVVFTLPPTYYRVVKVLISEFGQVGDFYYMRLKPNPNAVFSQHIYAGGALAISVKKTGLARGGSGTLAEGHLVITSA